VKGKRRKEKERIKDKGKSEVLILKQVGSQML
jgi:hypothetical protein